MPRTKKQASEAAVRDIRRKTRRRFSAEEKIRIVLDGIRGELRPRDVLLGIDGHPIANDLTVASPAIGRVHYSMIYQSRQIGERVTVSIPARRSKAHQDDSTARAYAPGPRSTNDPAAPSPGVCGAGVPATQRRLLRLLSPPATESRQRVVEPRRHQGAARGDRAAACPARFSQPRIPKLGRRGRSSGRWGCATRHAPFGADHRPRAGTLAARAHGGRPPDHPRPSGCACRCRTGPGKLWNC